MEGRTVIQLTVTNSFDKEELFKQNSILNEAKDKKMKDKNFYGSSNNPMSVLEDLIKNGTKCALVIKVESLPEEGTDKFKFLAQEVFGVSRSLFQNQRMNLLVMSSNINLIKVPEINTNMVSLRTLNPRKR